MVESEIDLVSGVLVGLVGVRSEKVIGLVARVEQAGLFTFALALL